MTVASPQKLCNHRPVWCYLRMTPPGRRSRESHIPCISDLSWSPPGACKYCPPRLTSFVRSSGVPAPKSGQICWMAWRNPSHIRVGETGTFVRLQKCSTMPTHIYRADESKSAVVCGRRASLGGVCRTAYSVNNGSYHDYRASPRCTPAKEQGEVQTKTVQGKLIAVD